jgi:PAS domain S-box-containing protein
LAEERGTIDEILVIVLEITQRKRAEHAEQAAQQRLQLAIHAAKVGLWDWDLQANRVHYSHEWKLQLGCTDDEVGDNLAEWERRVHPDDLPRAQATVMAYLAAPWANFEQEFRMQHKDGTYRWILAQGSVYLDAQSRPLHMLGSHSHAPGRHAEAGTGTCGPGSHH